MAKVYNLSVEGEREFVANRVIVHNCDELAAWRYAEAWDQAMFGLRIGDKPQAIITTTPRATKLIKVLVADPKCHSTKGTTYDNAANLADPFLHAIVRKYEGTRLGRQELNAEILDDTPGALWNRAMLDALRVKPGAVPVMRRVVIAIDPAITTGEHADETGIIAVGLGEDGQGYVLEDVSGVYTPIEWARKAIGLYRKHRADRIVAERNQGGDMVESTVRMVDANVPFTSVWASKGKFIRAEPVSALYEQGKIHHVGVFAKLEDQMCVFTPDFDRKDAKSSPDRLDSLVWGLTELFIAATEGGFLDFYGRLSAEKAKSEARENVDASGQNDAADKSELSSVWPVG